MKYVSMLFVVSDFIGRVEINKEKFPSLCLQSISAFFYQIQNGLTPVFDHSWAVPFPGIEEVLLLEWNILTFGEGQ